MRRPTTITAQQFIKNTVEALPEALENELRDLLKQHINSDMFSTRNDKMEDISSWTKPWHLKTALEILESKTGLTTKTRDRFLDEDFKDTEK
jgi:hypothetical protein